MVSSGFVTSHRMTALDLNSPAYCLDLSDVTSEQHVKSEIQPIFLPTRNQSLQASTANPFSDAISFAIATSNGALVLNESQGDWAIKLSALHIDSHGVTDVDWLSPNVIMKGCKDGGVRLWDIRTRGENRDSRFQHPSQINYARRIDETTIVVAGHESHVRISRHRRSSDLLTFRAMYLRSAVPIRSTIHAVSLVSESYAWTFGGGIRRLWRSGCCRDR